MTQQVVMKKHNLFSKPISTKTDVKPEERKIPETSQLGATTYKVTLKSVLNAAHKTTHQLRKVSTLCLGDQEIKPEGLDIVGE